MRRQSTSEDSATMTSFLTNAVAFIALISILVAVHEYGHYIVGRWTGMKVLRFSIGFGKPVWTRIGGKDNTEYCVSAIPLGGYVRFLDSREGDVEPEDEGRAFDQRPIPARIAVLLAGPGFNFIFAILAYWFLLAGGVEDIKPAIGIVEPESYAADAGLEFGDKIVAVGSARTNVWDETLLAMLNEMVDDGRIPMTLESSDGRERQVVIDVGDARSRLTEPGQLWEGIGFTPWQRSSTIGTVDEDSAAGRAGFLAGDRITAVDGTPVVAFGQLTSHFEPKPGESVNIEFLRDGRANSMTVVLGSVERDENTVGVLGVLPEPVPEDLITRRSYTPLQSLNAAVIKTWSTTAFTVKMLSRMVTGDVSMKNISGPINIAQIAGASVERGWSYFVSILAVISISLGVLNLLPVPVLDGGQIVYQIVEALKGGPMTERAQILGQQVGILALLVLMSFAFYNDIARLFD